MSADQLPANIDSLDSAEGAEMLRLLQQQKESVGGSSDEEEMLRLLQQQQISTAENPDEAQPAFDVIETRDIPYKRVFEVIQLTLSQAIDLMGGRNVVLDVDTRDETSIQPKHEVVHLSAGAAIALITGAKVANYWSELGDSDAREAFRASTMKKLACELERVNLDYHQLFQDPVWHAIFEKVVNDEREGNHTADELAQEFDASVLSPDRTFSVGVLDDDREQVAVIVSATLAKWEKLTKERRRLSPRVAEPISPYDSAAVIQKLHRDVSDVLGELHFDIMYPAGNVTCLIQVTPQQLQDDRAVLIEKATRLVNEGHVEQVGFFYESGKDDDEVDAELSMSGGEFCLNATISLAALLYARKQPTPTHDLRVQCSGGSCPISCECHFNEDNTVGVRAIFPVDPMKYWIAGGALIRLPGIAHFVIPVAEGQKFDPHGKEKLESFMASNAELIKNDPAVGLIQYKIDDHGLDIDPTVHVRATNTTVNETACGSGTVAATFVMVERARAAGDEDACQWAVAQPSGSWLTAKYKEQKEFQTPAVVIKTNVKKVCSSEDSVAPL